MLDLSFEKLLVIGVIALFLIGPQRLPHYAAQLGKWVRLLRTMTDGAKERLRDEMGEDVDWEQLDPRRYDPRRIIRDALLEEPAAEQPRKSARRSAAEEDAAGEEPSRRAVPLFDDQAT
ncbi:MAG: sec-independent protein translocase protein TatB [Microbacteriaceae bacterium]|jgi:sec-independent protein translocase protein TatB|nr:sec-independent protein translocase protein TatB [Microbacteriaceae bacterium]